MTTTPNADSKYIGLANTTSSTPPTSYTSYRWALIKGADGAQGQQGIPGPKGADGQTTYTWVRYADDENGGGRSNNPDGKRYIGVAFNKTTPPESNNASDYRWSPLYDNVKVGGRNLLLGTSKEDVEFNFSSYNGPGYRVVDDKFEEIAEGGIYTASVVITELETTGTNLALMISFRNSSGGAVLQITSHPQVLSGNQTGRIVFTTEIPPVTGASYIEVHLRNVLPSGSSSGKYKEMQFEKGNIATDWSSAPEDIQDELNDKAGHGDIDNLAGIISDISAEVNAKAGMGELQAMEEAFNARLAQDIADKEALEQALADIEGRTTLIEILA